MSKLHGTRNNRVLFNGVVDVWKYVWKNNWLKIEYVVAIQPKFF